MLRHLALSTLLLAAFAAPALAQEAGGSIASPTIKLGVGYGNAFDAEDNSTDFKVDLRSNWAWFGMIDPFVAFEANTDGGLFGGVGLTGDIHLTPQWIITPSFAAGLYEEGSSVVDAGSVTGSNGTVFLEGRLHGGQRFQRGGARVFVGVEHGFALADRKSVV